MKKLLLLTVILFLAGCVSTYSPDLCNGHNLGDSWLSEDGCNTCYCDKSGIKCTQKACSNYSNDFLECQSDEKCEEKAMMFSHCRSTGKCIDNKCVFECIEEDNLTADLRFDYAEGNCIVSTECIAAGEGCGGGHSICTNTPEKYKDRITTCDINMNHPTNQGFYCTCIVEQNKCGWKKQ